MSQRLPRRIRTLALSAVLLGSYPLAFANQQADRTVDVDKTKPDNTKVNRRDRKKGELTADQQKQNSQDVQLSAKIRRAIMKDKALSGYAKNIKVISRDGVVTLKGPVHSEEEKKALEAKANEVAGGNVKSEIEVAPGKTNSSGAPQQMHRKKRHSKGA